MHDVGTQGEGWDCVRSLIPCRPAFRPAFDLATVWLGPRRRRRPLQVYVCPPVQCLSSCKNCDGHEFEVKSVRGCVNTSAEIGTTYIVQFHACDRCAVASRGGVQGVGVGWVVGWGRSGLRGLGGKDTCVHVGRLDVTG